MILVRVKLCVIVGPVIDNVTCVNVYGRGGSKQGFLITPVFITKLIRKVDVFVR